MEEPLPPSSTLKMEEMGSSKMLLSTRLYDVTFQKTAVLIKIFLLALGLLSYSLSMVTNTDTELTLCMQ